MISRKLPAKSHNGIKTQFHKEFVKTKIISEKFGELYSELFDMRHEGDYQDFIRLKKEDVFPLFQEVKSLIEVVQNLISS